MAYPDLPAVLDALVDSIRHDLTVGFDSPTDIVASAVTLQSDGVDPLVLRLHVHRILEELLAEQLAEQVAWPVVTDCDRLDAAFVRLEQAGIICRQHFMCCGTCGAVAIWDTLGASRQVGAPVRGYAFYHAQDTVAGVAGDGLYLSYGAAAEGEEPALEIAREVIAALAAAGLATDWNGTWARRIHVAVDWKRRLA